MDPDRRMAGFQNLIWTDGIGVRGIAPAGVMEWGVPPQRLSYDSGSFDIHQASGFIKARFARGRGRYRFLSPIVAKGFTE